MERVSVMVVVDLIVQLRNREMRSLDLYIVYIG